MTRRFEVSWYPAHTIERAHYHACKRMGENPDQVSMYDTLEIEDWRETRHFPNFGLAKAFAIRFAENDDMHGCAAIKRQNWIENDPSYWEYDWHWEVAAHAKADKPDFVEVY